MLGKGSMYAKMCRNEGYIGAEFDIFVDLSDVKDSELFHNIF